MWSQPIAVFSGDSKAWFPPRYESGSGGSDGTQVSYGDGRGIIGKRIRHKIDMDLVPCCWGVGGAVRFLVVGTIG